MPSRRLEHGSDAKGPGFAAEHGWLACQAEPAPTCRGRGPLPPHLRQTPSPPYIPCATGTYSDHIADLAWCRHCKAFPRGQCLKAVVSVLLRRTLCNVHLEKVCHQLTRAATCDAGHTSCCSHVQAPHQSRRVYRSRMPTWQPACTTLQQRMSSQRGIGRSL